MAIAFRASASNSGGNTSHQGTVVIPASTANLDFMVMWLDVDNLDPVTDPPGWSRLIVTGGLAGEQQFGTAAVAQSICWTKQANGTDHGTTVTLPWTPDADNWTIELVVYSGTAAAVHSFSATSVPSATTARSTPSTNITAGSCWIVNHIADRGTPSSTTPFSTIPSGVTQRESLQTATTTSITSATFDSAGVVGTGSQGIHAYAGDVSTKNVVLWTIAIAPTGGTNLPPVANAGVDQSVTTATTVTLNGTGSSDPDGTIQAYLWRQISGTTVSLSSTTVASPTFTAPTVFVPATLVFGLTVTDNFGLQSSEDTVTITNNPTGTTLAFRNISMGSHTTGTSVNSATGPASTVTNKELTSNVATLTMATNPLVNANGWIIVTGVDATFNGTWQITSFTTNTVSYAVTHANVTSVASGGTVNSIWFKKPTGIVSGDFSIAQITMANQDTVTDPTGWTRLGVRQEGTNFQVITWTRTCDGTSTDQPEPSWTNAVKWIMAQYVFQGGGSVQTFASSTENSTTASHTAPTVTVTGSACWLLETVADRGSPSSTTFTNTAECGTTRTSELDLALGGSGTISMQWSDSNGTVSSGTRGGGTWVASLSTAHAIMFTIAVQGGGPISNPGTDQQVAAGQVVQLDGTGSIPTTGTISTYAWTQTAGDTVTLSSSSASQPTFTAPLKVTGQVLTFSLVVTNSVGQTSTANTVNVNVNQATEMYPHSGAWKAAMVKKPHSGSWSY